MKGIGIGICAVVAVFAIGVAGCGSSDDTSSTATTASITKDEFLAQGNQICADGNKTIDAAAQDTFTGGKPSEEEIVAFQSDVVIPSVEDQVAQLKALGIPAGDEEQLNALYASVDSAIAELQQDTDAGTVNKNTFGETNKLAEDYGLTTCGG